MKNHARFNKALMWIWIWWYTLFNDTSNYQVILLEKGWIIMLLTFLFLSFFILKQGLEKKLDLFKSFRKCMIWDRLKLIPMGLLEVAQVMMFVVTFLKEVVVNKLIVSPFILLFKNLFMWSLWVLFFSIKF